MFSVEMIFMAVLVGASFAITHVLARRALRGGPNAVASQASAKRPSEKETKEETVAGFGADEARKLLGRLHSVAASIGRDVDEHNLGLEEITKDLATVDGHEVSAELVLHAVERIADANQKISSRLTDAKKTIRQQKEFIESQMTDAMTDALTGAGNRRAFDKQLQDLVDEWTLKQSPFSLIMLDLDRFKLLNDTLGHRAGDAVLKAIVQVLNETVRGKGQIARYGGEEFAVILPQARLEDATDLAERIGVAIRRARLSFEGKFLQVTVSIGVTRVIEGDKAGEIIERADQALYASKGGGRDCAHYHDGRTCKRIGAPPPQAHPAGSPEAKGRAKADGLADAAAANREAEAALPSRADFQRELTRRLAEFKRTKMPLAISLVAMDNLAAAAQLGVQTRQNALDVITKILGAVSREIDFLARYDEGVFAVLYPGNNLGDACIPAERLRVAVAHCDAVRPQGRVLRLTVSCGVASVALDDDTDRVLDRASIALEAAQKSGGNCIHVHDGDSSHVAIAESSHA